ncbi:MAG TPA: TonB-dependent receptor [Longimicrobiales bacterium]
MARCTRFSLLIRTAAPAILSVLVGAVELHAQTPADSVRRDSTYTLEELIVRGTRPTATSGGASAIEVRVDSMRLPAAPTLEDVARALPLLQIRMNSRGEAQPTLRGAESREIAVLVDGVPLTLGWDHRTDLSVVPMTAAQGVTLLRGLPSVLHGPNVMGGVVEVSVARGPRGPLATPPPPPLRASLGVDHTGATTLGVIAGHRIETDGGRWTARVGGGFRNRSGFEMPGGVPGATPVDGLRLNSDLEHVDGFGALRYNGEDGKWFSASASGFRAERGVPPELHTESPRLWRYPLASRLLAAISAGTGQRATPFGAGDLEASVGIDFGRTEIESYTTREYTTIEGTEDADDRILSLRLLGDHTLGSRGELRAAVTLADIRHDEVIDGGAPSHYRQRLWSFGTEVAWRLDGSGLLSDTRLTAGIAYDGGDTPESGDKPALGRLGAWGARFGVNSVAADGAVMLHAGVSRRVRFPSLRELYSGALGRFVPNPTLRPPVLVAGEAGVTAKLGGVELQAVGFHQRLSDVIVRASTGDGRLRRENRDEMRSTGLELVAGALLGPTSLTGDLTLQHVEILDPTAPAGERKPEYQPSIAGSVDWTVPLPFQANGTVAAEYIGEQWCVHPDLGTDVALEPSTRLDLALDRGWGPFHARVSLDNVTDATVYDQCGLPQPGRTLRFQIRFR